MKRLLAWMIALSMLCSCSAPVDQETTEPPVEPTPPPVTQQPEVHPEPEEPSRVYTDWSNLTPYEPMEPSYTRYEPYSGAALQANDDYGPLLIYMGAEMTVSEYIVEVLPLYGLVTADGRLVTEPVYAEAYFQGPFLLLSKGEVHNRRQEEWGTVLEGAFSYTIAAADGSWVWEAGEDSNAFLLNETQMVVSCSDGSVVILNADGSIGAEFSKEILSPYLGENYYWGWDGGATVSMDSGRLAVWVTDWSQDSSGGYRCYLDPVTGAVSGEPMSEPGEWEFPGTPLWENIPEFPGYGYVEPMQDQVTGKIYYFGTRKDTDPVVHDFLDESGTVVVEDYRIENIYFGYPRVRAGLISQVTGDIFRYYSLEDGSEVFRYLIRSNSD